METKQAGHTPGPWQHGENEYSGRLNQPPLLPNAFQRIYMPGNAMVFVTGEAREANARLIAAAPKLLAALQDELEALKVWLSDNHTWKREVRKDIRDGMCISVAKITAAIAQATGQDK